MHSPAARTVLALTLGLVLALFGCTSSDTPSGPGNCGPGLTRNFPATDRSHVPDGTDVTYDSNPPCAGPHYASPAPGGAYTTELAPERYVHDLEHGAVVFLYDCPSGCADVVSQLQDIADARAPDAGGAFRWIITPNSGMSTRVAVVAWEWVYTADCVHDDEITEFIDEHYRHAPEDFPLP